MSRFPLTSKEWKYYYDNQQQQIDTLRGTDIPVVTGKMIVLACGRRYGKSAVGHQASSEDRVSKSAKIEILVQTANSRLVVTC